MVGFDGNQMDGRAAIETYIGGVFGNHKTVTYVWKVREIRFLTPEIAMLCAVAGMIPPGKTDINPTTNAIQSLVAEKLGNHSEIALFQNTPAQFHGRLEAVEALTEELRKLL